MSYRLHEYMRQILAALRPGAEGTEGLYTVSDTVRDAVTTDDSAASTKGMQIHGKYEATQASHDDGDGIAAQVDEYGNVINHSFNSDDTTGADKTVSQNPVWSRYSVAEEVAAAFNPGSAAFTVIGGEIDCRGYNKILLHLNVTIGTCTDIQIESFALHTSAGDEYAYPITEYATYDDNATDPTWAVGYDADENNTHLLLDNDENILTTVEIDVSAVSYLQLKGKDTADGSGTIAVHVTKIY